MALAYSDELAEKVRIAINENTERAIGEIHFEIFGKTVKQSCGDCYNKAIEKLIHWKRKGAIKMSGGKYRISEKYKDKVFSVNIGGTTHRVTAENLSVATAEAIMNTPNLKKDIIELNPDFKGVEVKKNILEGAKEPLPILSTSEEAGKGGKKSKKNVSEKESDTTESKPLTEKKKKSEKG